MLSFRGTGAFLRRPERRPAGSRISRCDWSGRQAAGAKRGKSTPQASVAQHAPLDNGQEAQSTHPSPIARRHDIGPIIVSTQRKLHLLYCALPPCERLQAR